jgi:ParB-like chromosome segregation protein Spo0J
MTPTLHTHLATRPIEALIPYARNSRTHSDEQVAQVAASIREFGFTNPVLIDEAGGIIAGHGRVLAARKLGLAEVPCLTLAGLTEAQKRAYVIADNKLALNAGWDEDLLALEIKDLQGMDFDLDLLGFDAGELDELLALGDATPEGHTDPDAVPEPQAQAITVPGDIWQLGKHRLMCGDSTSATDVESLLGGGDAASHGH